jgi:hypothetical protein
MKLNTLTKIWYESGAEISVNWDEEYEQWYANISLGLGWRHLVLETIEGLGKTPTDAVQRLVELIEELDGKPEEIRNVSKT